MHLCSQTHCHYYFSYMYACMYVYMYVCRYICIAVKGEFRESVFSLYHIDPRGQTQATRLSDRRLYPLNNLAYPCAYYFD